MDYIGNINYWDTKFKSRGVNPLEADAELIKHIDLLSEGSVLDIACGDGRNSLYLSEKGFKVTGVDFSSEALNRLNNFAKEYQYDIKTLQVDLSKAHSLESVGCFNNIIVNHYRLPDYQMNLVSGILEKGGVLFVTGFGHKHKPDEKIKDKDLIRKSDFECLQKDMEQIYYHEYSDERGFFVTYMYKKI